MNQQTKIQFNKGPDLVSPYKEGTTLWHAYVDVQSSTDGGNRLCTLEDLILDHGMSIAWYEASLPKLVLDGHVSLWEDL